MSRRIKRRKLREQSILSEIPTPSRPIPSFQKRCLVSQFLDDKKINFQYSIRKSEEQMRRSFYHFCVTKKIPFVNFINSPCNKDVLKLIFYVSSMTQIYESIWSPQQYTGFQFEKRDESDESDESDEEQRQDKQKKLRKQRFMLWNFILQYVTQSRCQYLKITEAVQQGQKLFQTIKFINFPMLKCLQISQILIDNMEFIAFLNVPVIQSLYIYSCKVKNIKAIQKVNFKHLKQIQLTYNSIKNFQCLQRTKISSDKLIKMCLFNIDKGSHSLIDLTFLVKVQLIKKRISTLIKIANRIANQFKKQYHRRNRYFFYPGYWRTIEIFSCQNSLVRTEQFIQYLRQRK